MRKQDDYDTRLIFNETSSPWPWSLQHGHYISHFNSFYRNWGLPDKMISNSCIYCLVWLIILKGEQSHEISCWLDFLDHQGVRKWLLPLKLFTQQIYRRKCSGCAWDLRLLVIGLCSHFRHELTSSSSALGSKAISLSTHDPYTRTKACVDGP